MGVPGNNLLSASCLTCLLLLAGAASAQAQTQTGLVYHRFRFFLHPDLAANLSSGELNSRLTTYLQDLNTIFAKNTVRRFVFDAETDVTVTASPPPIGYFPGGELPETNYEVWAMVKSAFPFPYSYGGWMSFTTNGTGVAADLYWNAVHDRTALSNAAPDDFELWNYWRQLHNLAHEVGHIFGAGVGEYYSLRNVPDTTGAAPLQNLAYPDYGPTSDPYWSQHPDYWTDPMLMWTPRLSWVELIDQVRFADVTAAMINAGFRNALPVSRYVPDLSAVAVVVSIAGTPQPNTFVKVWKVMAHSPFTAQPIFEGLTSSAGAVQFRWDGQPDNEDNLLLLKAWPANAPPIARWYSFYDAQEQRMVLGRTNLNIYLTAVVTNVAPTLMIRASAEGLVIGWPVAITGYLLESTTSLSAPDWRAVTQGSVSNATQQAVIWTNPGGAGFFRLRHNPP